MPSRSHRVVFPPTSASGLVRRFTLSSLALAISTTLLATPAQAYSDIHLFGDSLSDSGQFPDTTLGGLNSLRFTNRSGPDYENSPYGSVSTQLLATELGLAAEPSTSVIYQLAGFSDGTNYAVGGYTTAQILASVTDEDGSEVVIPAGSPGGGTVLRVEDGYLVSTGGSADPDALYYVNGGGNDFLQGVITSPATAVASAGNLAAAVEALAAAGATTIMVSNLPDVGSTPAGQSAGAAQAAGTSALVGVFNDALGERLAALDGQVNIIRLDTVGILEEVLASPAEFGFASDVPLTQVCFSDSCNVTPYGLGGTAEDPDKLLFNDGVHPTSAGQEILADYAYAMLAAPSVLGLAPQLGTGALNASQRSLADELRPGAQHPHAGGETGVRVFAIGSATGGTGDGETSTGQQGVDSEQRGAGVGVMLPLDNALGRAWGGVAVSQRHADFDVDDGSELELEGQVFSLFARQQLGRVGMQAVASYGDFEYDLDRHVALGQSSRTLSGETDGDGFSAEARLDYRLTAADSLWYNAPFVAYRHTESDIDGYTESGSAANALSVSDQTLRDRRVELGFMVDRAVADGFGLYGELAYGKRLDDDAESAEVRLASLPTNAYSAEDLDRGSDNYLRVDGGWRMQLGRNAMLHLGAGIETWDEVTARGEVGVSYTF
ncbi:autotransporter domain-containing protein [Cobetia marina]|uniref:autotransporter outer membrane beta-barrel domain-containing protein n=1 Tax=Cobetia marina TaxID=28258 RepID=UPI0026E42D0E|nr:autotransporter domain-containing protein [Cobetia marina]MDO6786088.1 autotransporter domain-containing protein [Cobetia marina]